MNIFIPNINAYFLKSEKSIVRVSEFVFQIADANWNSVLIQGRYIMANK